MTKESRITFKAIYYERVSTIDVSQDESMENQRRLVKSYLSNLLNPWTHIQNECPARATSGRSMRP